MLATITLDSVFYGLNFRHFRKNGGIESGAGEGGVLGRTYFEKVW